ncbi:PLxRFG domain-containing protein [Methylomagnum ishizawai]|uniref:PLxRFG domain-containing protein n=1 Tax=Methylomagnum ishizawai TaxID=1760988 RepID=UPI001C335E5F|nr:PLxRFG domain-containing protein [Methylomagnum ishizawai]BBL74201.1 hypothetical protein MishRS11D_12990 [Methylomagnum ishizawai]
MNCLEKHLDTLTAQGRIDPAEGEALLRAAEALRAGGMAWAEAQVRAIDDRLEALRTERARIGAGDAAPGTVPVLTSANSDAGQGQPTTGRALGISQPPAREAAGEAGLPARFSRGEAVDLDAPVEVLPFHADPDMPDVTDTPALRRYLKQKYQGGKYRNEQTGQMIGVFASGLEAALKNRNALARRLYGMLPDLLGKAIFAEYTDNIKTEAKPGVVGYETYYAAVEIDGKPYSVRVLVDTVRDEARGRGYYYHQVREVGLGDPVGYSRSQSGQGRTNYPAPPSDRLTLRQLLGDGKSDRFSRPRFSGEADQGGGTPESIRAELVRRFGGRLIRRLERAKRLHILDSWQALRRFAPDAGPNDKALFAEGRVYLVAPNIRVGDAVGVFLHETGVHGGLADWLGGRFPEFVARFHELAGAGDAAAVRAEAQVQRLLRDGALKPADADEERIAYLVEYVARLDGKDRARLSARVRAWVREVVAALRAALYASPFGEWLRKRGFGLTSRDFAALARAAVRRSVWDAGDSSPPMASRIHRAPMFYSALTRAVQGMKQPKAPGAQWMAMIGKAPGVKPEEVAWSGVGEWLAGRAGSVGKQELLDFLAGNEVRVEEAERDEPVWSAYVGGDPKKTAKYAQRQLPGGEGYRELLLTLPGGGYQSPHWDEPGVLAHVRFNERTDAGGRRVLFLEEAQSDLHQEGRKRGYGAEGVPDAPFKQSWPLLALKRMIRYAAENGFDRIAWTPGAAQAERFPGGPERERGMAGFYDRILPAEVGKYVKKWGAKPGRAMIGGVDAHVVDITPAMKLAALEEGQPLFSRSAMKDIDANIRRGRDALAKAVLEKTSVHRAMFRNGLGWVDFVWGKTGRVKPSGKTVGGMGLAHILEARGRKDGMAEAEALRLFDHLIETIAAGTEIRRNETGGSIRAVIAKGGYEAVLVRNRGSNAWVLSGWRVNPGASVEANDTDGATHIAADSSDRNMGAGFDPTIGPHDGIDNIRFSRADPERPEPDPAEVQASAREMGRAARLLKRGMADFRDGFDKLGDGAQALALGGFTVRMNAELARDYLPTLEQRFVPAMAAREAVAGQVREYFARRIGLPFEKLYAAHPAEADALAGLLQEATITGVDPGETERRMLRRAAAGLGIAEQPGWEDGADYQALVREARDALKTEGAIAAASGQPPRDALAVVHNFVTGRLVAHYQSQIASINRRLGAESIKTNPLRQMELFEQRKYFETAIGHEINRDKARGDVVGRYLQLSSTVFYSKGASRYSARSLFSAVLRFEDRIADLETAALERKIGDLEMDARQKAKVMATLRRNRQALRVRGPYVPLSRFGRFWVASKERDGTETDVPLTLQTLGNGGLLVSGRELRDHEEWLRSMGGRYSRARGGMLFGRKRAGDIAQRIRREGLLDRKAYVIAGAVHYERFETARRADERRAEIEADTKLEWLGHGLDLPDASAMRLIDPAYVAEVDTLLAGLGATPEVEAVRDALYQGYLRRLPEVSAQKHWLHRKKTPGFSQDVLRALASKAVHDAHNIARIKHGYPAFDALDEAEQALRAAGTVNGFQAAVGKLAALETYQRDWLGASQLDFEVGMDRVEDVTERKRIQEARRLYGTDSVGLARAIARQGRVVAQAGAIRARGKERAAALVVGEMKRAYADAANPTIHPLALKLNGLGFAMHMGISPAAALVNTLQVPIMSMPVVAARFGAGPTNAAFGKALGDFFQGARNREGDISIETGLDAIEQRALYRVRRRGTLDKTLAHDTSELSNDPALLMAPRRALRRVMAGMFHHAERFNREVSFVAAFRLARAAGDDFDTAYAYAEKVLHDTHYDYSQWNRARLMRGDVARVVFQFKQYALGTTWLLTRNFLWTVREFLKAAKGEQSVKDAFRSEAYKTLAGIMGMQMVFAGALGLPFVGGIAVAVNLAAKGFTDDDDEPFEFEVWFRRWAAETFGVEAGNALGKGLFPWAVGQIPGVPAVDLQGKLSMADLWWREPDRELAEDFNVVVASPLWVQAAFGGVA